MRGFAKRCWTASRIAPIFWRPVRNRIASAEPLKSKRKEPKQPNSGSRGNDGPWKAWKTKDRFSTLPTALGNRCDIPTSPPFQLPLLNKETTTRVRKNPPHLRINNLEVGQNKLPKWAEYSCQTHETLRTRT